MRWWIVPLIVAAAVYGGPRAVAEEGDDEAAEKKAREAAEDVYLRAYFLEKETRDLQGAERQYGLVVEKHPKVREIVGRALVGRARCLRALDRADEATAVAGSAREYADVPEVEGELRAFEEAAAQKPRTVEQVIEDIFRQGNDPMQYGDRAVPILTRFLRDDEPDIVARAASALTHVGTPAATKALADALTKSDTTYPRQLAAGALTSEASDEVLRAGARTQDPGIRGTALRAAYEAGRDWVYRAIVEDAATSEALIPSFGDQAKWPRLLVEAVAAGPGRPRDLALAAIRRVEPETGWPQQLGAFRDPPEAVLRDREVVDALFRAGALRGPKSAALARLLLEDPKTQGLVLDEVLAGTQRDGLDPDKLLDLMVAASHKGWSASDDCAFQGFVRLAGAPPEPARLRKIASLWQGRWDWRSFLEAIEKAGGDNAEAQVALLQGTSSARLRRAHLGRLLELVQEDPADWMADAFAAEIEDRDADARRMAFDGLKHSVDLSRHVATLGHALKNPFSAVEAASLLRQIGTEPAREQLVDGLEAGHSQTKDILAQLGELREPAAAGRAEQMLSSSADQGEVMIAARALVAIRQDAARPALVAAIERDGGRFARDILIAVTQPAGGLSPDELGGLFCVAVGKAPGRLGWRRDDEPLGQAVANLPSRALGSVASSALQSPAVEDRRFGAALQQTLLNAASWDELLKLATDPDEQVRSSATAALQGIRSREEELARLKSLGAERENAQRVAVLLKSESVKSRRAGVAAVVATRTTSLLGDLIRIAAEDPDATVAEDARTALLAFGRQGRDQVFEVR